MNQSPEIKLTQYSHGAGCGCKIAPKVLDKILSGNITLPDNAALIVGNHSKDDAAVLNLGNGTALISTTDFFMPIVDDPYQFGRIAAANAISDIYAMGGKPIMAIAILGWPINLLAPEIAQQVVDGGKSICLEAGISLAGGHSIDSPEPIFGLAVNGLAEIEYIKQNNTAKPGDLLYLTKPIGVGILTTAEKKGLLKKEHQGIAAKQMMQLNKIGEALGKIKEVHAMTDVTGFGLLGHLVEMTDGSGVSAEISVNSIKFIVDNIHEYLDINCVPGGTNRNFDSYGERIRFMTNNTNHKNLLADPQTSGGLLIAIAPEQTKILEDLFHNYGLHEQLKPIGRITDQKEWAVIVND